MARSVSRGYCFFGVSEGRKTRGSEGPVREVVVSCNWAEGEEGAVVNDSGEGIRGR